MQPSAIFDVIKAHTTKDQKWRDRVHKYIRWLESEHEQDAVNELRADADGDAVGDEIHTNYTYAFVDTMGATVCPSNPQVTVNAAKEGMKEIASARERLANVTMKREQLRKRIKRACSWTAVAGFGVLKTVWSSTAKRPKIRAINPLRFFYSTDTEWEDIRYCCELTLVPEDEFRLRMKAPETPGGISYNPEVAGRASFNAAPVWLISGDDEPEVPRTYKYAVVFEFYDFTESKLYHFLEGNPDPLLILPLPYKFVRNPYRLLVFNESLRSSRGVADIRLIENDQNQLDTIDSLELQHTKRSIPATVIDEKQFDDPSGFVDAYAAIESPGGVIRASMRNQTFDIRNAMTQTPMPTLSPSFGVMRGVVKDKISSTLGMPEYQRGQVGKGELATELALADASLKSRVGNRTQEVMGVVAGVARDLLGLYRQFLGGRVLSMRLDGSRFDLDADTLGFTSNATQDEVETEDWFDIDTVPYSPAESDRLVRLRSLQQFSPILIQSPYVNQQVLMLELLETLGMPHAFQQPAPQIGAVPPGAPVQGGGMNVPGAATDTPATGGPPPGQEALSLDPLVPTTGKADQPKASL